jgi:hypothetical protein
MGRRPVASLQFVNAKQGQEETIHQNHLYNQAYLHMYAVTFSQNTRFSNTHSILHMQ